ncbi:MAG: hypothetical protein RKR03_18045 [Candidatus Competibacter sp.]|nr:hypothetical protein [Candidatus Competibacter sp.]
MTVHPDYRLPITIHQSAIAPHASPALLAERISGTLLPAPGFHNPAA